MADEEEQPLEISWRDLSASALDSLIEEFVTRDGTDYGAQEKDLASRKRDVRRQIEHGEGPLRAHEEIGGHHTADHITTSDTVYYHIK